MKARIERLLAAIGLLAILLLAIAWATGRKAVKTELHPAELQLTPDADAGEEIVVAERPRNIILVVADGLGFGHLAAGRASLHGIDGETAWDSFPIAGWHRSHPVNGLITDSATAATALATGHSTNYGYVGMGANDQRLVTLFERAAELGYRTGLVTDSYIWDATPASFVAHVKSRDLAEEILRQLAAAPLDVIFGELEDIGEGEVPTWADSEAMLAESYTVVGPEPASTQELLDIDSGTRVAAIFEEEQVTDLDSSPTLLTLERAALGRISASGEPFVLLVESEELDSASHRRDLPRTLRGFEVIEQVLYDLLDFAAADGNTLVVFTSDHETGGLAISTTSGNRSLKAIWSSTDHTASAVPLFAIGPGAELFAGAFPTWRVGRILMSLLSPPTPIETSIEPASAAP